MKLIIDIPDRTIDKAKRYLIGSCDSEEEEVQLQKVCDKMKNAEEPVALEDVEPNEWLAGTLKEIRMGLAVIAISLQRIKSIEESSKENNVTAN